MGGEDSGLTLRGLAQRLEALERENERMRSVNAELRDEVTALRGSGISRVVDEPASGSERRVSRSWLLRNVGAAALGTVAAGALLARDAREAKANHFDPGINVDFVWAHNEAATSAGVLGEAPNNAGVIGKGFHGVVGEATGTGNSGVSGVHTGSSGYGVVGDGKGSSTAGVLGRNSGGTGVRGEGSNQAEVAGVRGLGKTGVWGSTSATGYSGVYGEHTGSSGYGVVGDGWGASAGVLGRNRIGSGVRGEGAHGVQGKATSGYGGSFEGGKAQLRIVPKAGGGHPTTGNHAKGEIYMDSAANLFVCTVGGTPGTWRKVTTTAS